MTTVAVEDPGPVDHDAIARRSGMHVVPVPVDQLGLEVAALLRTPAGSSSTPAHQAPTGVVLAPERRHELVEWARAVDGFVVEDDYDAEFRYDRQPVGAVQGLAPDRVVTMGSTSKTLSPTLRMGWLVCPPRLHEAVGVEKHSSAAAPWARPAGARRARRVRTLRPTPAPDARRLQEPAGGVGRGARAVCAGRRDRPGRRCHAVLRLPAGVPRRTRSPGMASSVAVYGMSRYRSDRGTEPAELVLGFGNVKESAIVDAMRRVAPVLRGGRPARALGPSPAVR